MFSPNRQWPWSSMMLKNEARAKRHPTGQDKMVPLTDVPPPPPPMGLLSGDANRDDEDNMEDWRRFREVGLLDEAALERRDREALLEIVQRLERELFDYQYNMGLLLIEKKEWTSKNEELQESLLEAHEILKREKTANLIAVTQVEEREANLRQSLDIERQRISELERSLRELSSEHEKIKMASDCKLADANNLVAGIQDSSLEVQQKLVAADSKLAEASRKSLALDRKLQEVETRESILKRECISFASERDAHEATVLKHKEDMLEWERKLQEGEERLSKNRRNIYDKEEEVNELNKMLKEREKELEKEQKKVELQLLTLKEEEGINRRLAELIGKEEKAESLRSSIEKREKELIALTEKLSSRERVEINIVDEHRTSLALKERDLEINMLNKRKQMERALEEKEREFEEKKKTENCHIIRLKELVEKEMDKINSEKNRLEKERQNNEFNKQQLEEQQLEMQDINELGLLSQRLKLQREQFQKEKIRFVSFLDALKNCPNCGDIARDHILSDFHNSEQDDKGETLLFEKVAAYDLCAQKESNELDPKSSAGRISWLLHKCTPKFLSPSKTVHDFPSQNLDHALPKAESDKAGPSAPAGAASEVEVSEELSKGRRKYVWKTSGDGVCRTRSVKAVVEDAEVFLGRKSGGEGKNEDSTIRQKRARGAQVQSSKLMGGTEDGSYETEGHAESVTVGGSGRRKRHQTGPSALQNASMQRYNLRRHIKGRDVAGSIDTEQKADKVPGDVTPSLDNQITSATPEEVTSSQVGNHAELAKITSYKNIQTGIVSVDRVVRFQASAGNIDETDNTGNLEESVELSEGVSGTPEYNPDELEDDEEHEEENTGEVSIPRKIWTFFTS